MATPLPTSAPPCFASCIASIVNLPICASVSIAARGKSASPKRTSSIARTQLAKTKAEAKAIRMAADQKQLQLKSNEDKVKDLRRKLNAATSNREYQILLEQIAADEMANSVLADEILEALEKVDGFQTNIAEAEAALAAAMQKAAEVRGEVAEARAVAPGRHRPARSRVAAIRGDAAERHPRSVQSHRPPKGRRRLGGDRRPILRRLQPANPAELLQLVMLGQPVAMQNLRPLALSAGVVGDVKAPRKATSTTPKPTSTPIEARVGRRERSRPPCTHVENAGGMPAIRGCRPLRTLVNWQGRP